MDKTRAHTYVNNLFLHNNTSTQSIVHLRNILLMSLLYLIAVIIKLTACFKMMVNVKSLYVQ